MNAPFAPAVDTVGLVDLRDPGEFARVDAFVAGHGGNLFQRPAWLCAVERGSGQRARGLVAERGGTITGWLPLTEAHSPIFGRALVSSGFAVGGGPLAERRPTVELLCRTAQELAGRLACNTVELRSGDAPDDWERWNHTHCGFERPLAADDDAELLAILRKQRAEVRKSLSFDLDVSIGNAEASRAAHYAVYAESVRNLGTPVFPRSLFDAMLDGFGAEADILTVSWRGKPVASVLTFYHRDCAMPYWGGGTFAARRLRANERMYFELMVHARRRGCLRFDFGRSKTGSGPWSYKKNWGFEPRPLGYARWTAPGLAARDVDPTSAAHASSIGLWKRLPLVVTDALGPHIARGLA